LEDSGDKQPLDSFTTTLLGDIIDAVTVDDVGVATIMVAVARISSILSAKHRGLPVIPGM
jgi:hypothetical protein